LAARRRTISSGIGNYPTSPDIGSGGFFWGAAHGEQHNETANIHPTARQRSLFSRAVTVIAGLRIACATGLLTVRGFLSACLFALIAAIATAFLALPGRQSSRIAAMQTAS
jgi:hypothetical protein